MTTEFQTTCRKAGVIPVIAIDDAAMAADLGHAIAAGGLSIVELTLRTPAALPALTAMKAACPFLVVGMGTVLCADDAKRAADAGADFLVSPGLTDGLAMAANALALPFLPGVATPTDLMRALDHGFTFLKFFPAEAAGGIPYLKALGGPFGDASFCPTGGIGPDQVSAYLGLPNVVCVGGSWVASNAQIKAQDWDGIKRNADKAKTLTCA
ncbi:MAG: bifunctional 4-hydroxy-2-oxoglutarate aldolase/2-dehydro-3-deoxy-phosphogluconate aldolase [Robiginitomaculum sp.]|nr:bifunctional 4-hydroxy-2-oxoglutarate aldolase/2-dehydro-3-deoxy-phosphogluconate aldolase [Robiginitomaculum sp.]MDQ7077041.1 bifunctional 4-hydroxy-2-oxoglutarate aldolase/2-dehydro-3-deoxy-phosphogluconate aldolase [Robiginitomaculum sp.]